MREEGWWFLKHDTKHGWKNDDALPEKEVNKDHNNLQISAIMWDNY